MYDVLDVSRYIINYCNDKNKNISNLKLQKILYFIQAYFLLAKNEPCFKEEIEAWQYGPVAPEAYHEFKCYASGPIPKIDTYTKLSISTDPKKHFEFNQLKFNPDIISKDDQILINKVVDKFIDLSTSRLVEITHKQSPWLNAFKSSSNIISNNSIKEFFSKN